MLRVVSTHEVYTPTLTRQSTGLRRSATHGPMLPPTAETLAEAHLREQRLRMGVLRERIQDEDYQRRIAARAERAEYVRAAMACPICDRPSHGNVCPQCLHHEAVATRDMLEGFE